MSEKGLTKGSQAWTIMEEVKRHPSGISVADIVRATGMDHQTVSKRMRAMVVAGHAIASDGAPMLYAVPGSTFPKRTQREMDATATTTAARVRMAMRRLGPCSIPQISDALGIGRELARHAVKKSLRCGLVVRVREEDGLMLWWVADEAETHKPAAPKEAQMLERRANPDKIAKAQSREWAEIKSTTKVETRVIDGVRVRVPVTTAPCGYNFRFTAKVAEPFFSRGQYVRRDGWAGAYVDGRDA